MSPRVPFYFRTWYPTFYDESRHGGPERCFIAGSLIPVVPSFGRVKVLPFCVHLNVLPLPALWSFHPISRDLSISLVQDVFLVCVRVWLEVG